MRRLLLAAATAVALLLTFAGPASAGGWAVTTLDEMPAGGLAAGRPTDVGYTIRQHGVTPVALDDTALVVTTASGKVLRFPGRPDGAVGHYLATVTVPEGGRLALSVDQGWFAPQDLGSFDVGSTATSAAATSGGGTSTLTVVAGVVTVLAAIVLLVQLGLLGMRHRRSARPAEV